MLDFSKDFSVLPEAAKLNVDDPIREIDSLKGLMMTLKNNLETCAKSNPPDQGFIYSFSKFKEDNLDKIVSCSEKSLKCKKYYIETAKLFGEDESTLAKKSSGVK